MPDASLTPEQQLEAQHFAAVFLQLAQREAERFGELLAGRPDTPFLGRPEFDLRGLVHQLGAAFLEAALEERKKGYLGSSIVCPHCQSDADLNGLRPRTVLGLLGGMKLRRHYYHCPDCGHGSVPFDQALGLDGTRQTPATREVMALSGAVESFPASADKLLEKLSGVRAFGCPNRRSNGSRKRPEPRSVAGSGRR